MNLDDPFATIAQCPSPKKRRPKSKKKHQRTPIWPQDFIGKPKSLRQMIDAKLSQWHDDDYDQGKDW